MAVSKHRSASGPNVAPGPRPADRLGDVADPMRPSGARVLDTAVVWSRGLLVVTVLIFAAVALLDPSIQPWAALAAAAVGLLAGVPHGALDHLLALRLCNGRSLILITLAYAALAALVWGMLVWLGTAGLLLVIALSALHFGLGELEFSNRLTGWRPGGVGAAGMVIAGCGALLLPLARSGEEWRSVATAVSPGLAATIGSTPIQIALATTWFVGAAVAMTVALRAGQRTVATDIGLIGALGALAPPLVAFAVWFGGWHALRHTARVLTVEPGCAALLADGGRRGAVLRLIRLAALPSLAVFTVVAVLVWFTASAPDPDTAMAQVLRLLLALTVPHMIVVFWLDRSQGSRDLGAAQRA